ncbi:MAG: hypothetical protein K6A35_09040 [bacterium]|nr:hypothetical protein [bacterium]
MAKIEETTAILLPDFSPKTLPDGNFSSHMIAVYFQFMPKKFNFCQTFEPHHV